jgi:AAA domain/FaeA-like protein
MLEPQTTYGADSHRYVYPQGVEVLVERFVEDRREGLMAEVSVRTDIAPHAGLLHRARLNLLATRSRASFVDAIAKRNTTGFLEGVDIAGILEQVCGRSVDHWRAGEPAVDLYDVPARETRWLLAPFVEYQGATILFGDGGAGKSLIALKWAILIARATDSPSMYLDWEADRYVHAERLRALGGGRGEVLYRRQAASITESRDAIRKEVAANGVGYVVIDSWGAARGGDADSSDLTIRAFMAARQIGVPWSAVDHLPKNAKDPTKPFGSVYTHNLARLTWRAEAVQDEGGDRLLVALRNFKANNGRLSKARAYELGFDVDEREVLTGVSIEEIDTSRLPTDKLSTKERILVFLRNEGLRSTEEVAEAAGIALNAARARLGELRKTGVVVRVGMHWGLQAH